MTLVTMPSNFQGYLSNQLLIELFTVLYANLTDAGKETLSIAIFINISALETVVSWKLPVIIVFPLYCYCIASLEYRTSEQALV